MGDETKNKIVQATLKLIIERGYTLTTTKDIAKYAGVSEVTIFRKFQNKQGIIEYILQEIQQYPELDMSILDRCTWCLDNDLKMFSHIYYKYVTHDYVKLIIGLRSPDLFPLIEKYVKKIPDKFKEILIKYFSIMYEKKKICSKDYESMAIMYISFNFGFIFMKTYFEDDVSSLKNEEYMEESIKMFIKGISV